MLICAIQQSEQVIYVYTREDLGAPSLFVGWVGALAGCFLTEFGKTRQWLQISHEKRFFMGFMTQELYLLSKLIKNKKWPFVKLLQCIVF